MKTKQPFCLIDGLGKNKIGRKRIKIAIGLKIDLRGMYLKLLWGRGGGSMILK
jgi:hypothetical protein